MNASYKEIYNSIAYLLLKPEDHGDGEPGIVTPERFKTLVAHAKAGVSDERYETKAQLILHGNIESPEALPDGLIAIRYEDVSVSPDGAPNRYAIQWNIAVDVLTVGNEPRVLGETGVHIATSAAPIHAGIYTMYRGGLVSNILQRCMAHPVLHRVIDNPFENSGVSAYYSNDDLEANIQMSSDDADDVLNVRAEKRVGRKYHNPYLPWHMSGADYYDGADANYALPKRDTGNWQLADSQGDITGPQISATAIRDTTDMNYWTLLWAHGLPEAFLGWWPITLTVTVVEKRYGTSVA